MILYAYFVIMNGETCLLVLESWCYWLDLDIKHTNFVNEVIEITMLIIN